MFSFLALPFQKPESRFCGLHTIELLMLCEWPVTLGSHFVPFARVLGGCLGIAAVCSENLKLRLSSVPGRNCLLFKF